MLKQINNLKENQYYIVRANGAGVFFGKIKERQGDEVLMSEARRLWYWDGANSLSQLAKEGTVRPENCKFTVVLDEILVLNVLEITPCTDKAISSIKGVSEWKI